tara:strand:+ start:1156 stop:2706 length:1551 start_codon:yes stop_codon:yes gene_type:complete
MAFFRSAATIGGYTLLSRILGFIRDILIAANLGVGPVADAFIVAFKLPNFFRRMFAEGAFNAAFVPMFMRQLSEGGLSSAKRFSEEVLSVFIIFLLFFVTALQIGMPYLMYGIAPGFSDDSYRFDLAVSFSQITFPYLLFISLVSQLGGVLNGLGRFAAAAATPILLNLCLIFSLLYLASFVENSGYALSWGVALAGVIQFVWLILACHRAGFVLFLRIPRLTLRLKRLILLMLPGVLGAGVIQINLLIDVIIASFLPQGSVSFLYYADRVNQLPLGVIGIAIGTVLLPLLSRQLRSREVKNAFDSMNRAIEYSIILSIPAAIGLILIPDEIISVLFERGEFGPEATRATGLALAAYSVGLPAYILIKVFGPGFYAREDTLTPVKIATLCVFVNLCLNLLLMGPLLHVGIALATAASAWLNAALLLGVLVRRGHYKCDDRLKKTIFRIPIATALMSCTVLVVEQWLVYFSTGSTMWEVFSLSIIISSAFVVFVIAGIFLGVVPINKIKQVLDRFFG